MTSRLVEDIDAPIRRETGAATQFVPDAESSKTATVNDHVSIFNR